MKNVSGECKCEFDGKKCSSKQNWNNDKFQRECKRPVKQSLKEEDFAYNLLSCACECDNIKNHGCCCKDNICFIKYFGLDKILAYER